MLLTFLVCKFWIVQGSSARPPSRTVMLLLVFRNTGSEGIRERHSISEIDSRKYFQQCFYFNQIKETLIHTNRNWNKGTHRLAWNLAPNFDCNEVLNSRMISNIEMLWSAMSKLNWRALNVLSVHALALTLHFCSPFIKMNLCFVLMSDVL